MFNWIIALTENEYLDASEGFQGLCTECRALTRDMTEPDAYSYDCPECGRNSVVGMDTALIDGLIMIKTGDE